MAIVQAHTAIIIDSSLIAFSFPARDIHTVGQKLSLYDARTQSELLNKASNMLLIGLCFLNTTK